MPIFEAFEAGAWLFWVLPDEIVIAEIPEAAAVDDERRLHRDDGPAFVWLSDKHLRGSLVEEWARTKAPLFFSGGEYTVAPLGRQT